MIASNFRFFSVFSPIIAIVPIAYGCSVVVAIGKEDPELTDYNPETDPKNDPLERAAKPKHPVLRYQEDRSGSMLKAPWAEKALKAREAQSLISTGNYFSCAENRASELKCWGFSTNGSLGKDPSNKDNTNYFDAYNNNLKKIVISAGASCVVDSNFNLTCHGSRDQIGIDTQQDSYKPVTPTGLSRARDLDARAFNVCAITGNGALKCWGWSFGKTPTEVPGLHKELLRVSLGTGHHCVLDSDFRALCWGSNSKGQLGLDVEKFTNRSAPVYVEGLPQGVTQIAVGGEHTCALIETGAVQCWGSNEKGQLGNGSTDNSSVPVQVSGLDSGVVAIDAGDAHTCALKEDGSVHCWGDNDKGELGNGDTDQQSVPVQVTGLSSPVLQFSSGPEFNCVLDSAKDAWCWGHGSNFNLLGDDERKDSSTPVQVKNFN